MRKLSIIFLAIALLSCNRNLMQKNIQKSSPTPVISTKLINPVNTDLLLELPTNVTMEEDTFYSKIKKNLQLTTWIIHGPHYNISGTQQSIDVDKKDELDAFLERNFTAQCENGDLQYRKLLDETRNSIRYIHFKKLCDITFGNTEEYFLISPKSLYVISLDNQPDTEQGVSQEKREIMESIVNNIRLKQ